MKLKDIIFLVAAVIAWLYSSYRTYQKQNAGKSKPIIDNTPVPEIPKPVARQMTTRKVQEKIPQRTKREYENTNRKSMPGSLEKMVTDIIPGNAGFPENLNVSEKKPLVHNIQPFEQKSLVSDNSINELIEEIHSGKIDWRKAIILNEIIRPVYFE